MYASSATQGAIFPEIWEASAVPTATVMSRINPYIARGRQLTGKTLAFVFGAISSACNAIN